MLSFATWRTERQRGPGSRSSRLAKRRETDALLPTGPMSPGTGAHRTMLFEVVSGGFEGAFSRHLSFWEGPSMASMRSASDPRDEGSVRSSRCSSGPLSLDNVDCAIERFLSVKSCIRGSRCPDWRSEARQGRRGASDLIWRDRTTEMGRCSVRRSVRDCHRPTLPL